jgi:2-phosphoglycerate kinase
MNTNDWRVLLIGGNSGAGKTNAAKELVHQLGIPFLMVDDVRIALQQVTTPTQQPDLHVFLNYQLEQWKQPELIVKDWLRVGNAMIKPLKEIMAHHIVVEGSGKIIIEGDGILPTLATQSTFSDIPEFDSIDIEHKIRVVFLIEDDEEVILNNLRQRGRGISSASKEEQVAFARASWLFGQRLDQEARTNQFPVLSAQPNETVIKRLLEIIL